MPYSPNHPPDGDEPMPGVCFLLFFPLFSSQCSKREAPVTQWKMPPFSPRRFLDGFCGLSLSPEEKNEERTLFPALDARACGALFSLFTGTEDVALVDPDLPFFFPSRKGDSRVFLVCSGSGKRGPLLI